MCLTHACTHTTSSSLSGSLYGLGNSWMSNVLATQAWTWAWTPRTHTKLVMVASSCNPKNFYSDSEVRQENPQKLADHARYCGWRTRDPDLKTRWKRGSTLEVVFLTSTCVLLHVCPPVLTAKNTQTHTSMCVKKSLMVVPNDQV